VVLAATSEAGRSRERAEEVMSRLSVLRLAGRRRRTVARL
jgi:hypothetical protein